MSKNLNVNSGNYTIRVTDGNTITLDTGPTGTTTLTGNLTVAGTTTTVNSTDLSLKDNIIKINDGETGSGITLNTAGIQFDRGTEQDALFLFDEQTSHNDPVTQTVRAGTFTFKDNSGAIRGILTNSITTGGGDLYLINSGTGVINVSGTSNYETQVTEDDDIPNKKYVDDAITTGIQTIQITSVARGNTAVNLFDDSLDNSISAIRFTVDGNERVLIKNDSTEIESISFRDNLITTTASGADLTLSSNGSPFVKIDAILRLPLQDDSSTVTYSPTHVAVYAKDPDKGKTGVWYKNKYDHEDELISTNRSLLYSMLF
tara:strand:- start:4364 stop:5314 length:951 start_codon:yes stop_codon:yes gene_type:complete